VRDALNHLDIDWIATEMRPLTNETFVVFDDKTPNSRVIMFASQEGLKRLVFSLNWYGDGTFRVVPRFDWQKVFLQLYTLSGEVLNQVFGSVYCLLERKDKNIYSKIFSFILHWAQQHGHTLTIVAEKGRLKTDLEKTVYQAAKEVFGDTVEPDTCQFHFSQVNQRIIDNAGHRKTYYSSESSKEDVRLCNNLPFVPLEFIEQASRDLRAHLSAKGSIALCIVDHLDLYYIFGKPGRSGDLVAPRFPPHFWNKYITVLRKERRSTNVMEAFHRALLDIIEVAHPSMMSFVKDLWQVATVADRDASLTAAAIPNVRRRGEFEREEDDRIFKIVDQYDTYPSIIDYLKALSLKPKPFMPRS